MSASEPAPAPDEPAAPFLGGWHDTLLGVMHLHASTCTDSLPAPIPPPPPPRATEMERSTQAAPSAAASVQSSRDACLQTAVPLLPGQSAPACAGRILFSRPYVRTSEVVQAARERACRALQARWRGVLGRRAAVRASAAAAARAEASRVAAARREEAERAAAAAVAAAIPCPALTSAAALARATCAALPLDSQGRRAAQLELVQCEAALAHGVSALRQEQARARARARLAERLAASAAARALSRSDGAGTVAVETPANTRAGWRARLHREAAPSAAAGGERRGAFLRDAAAFAGQPPRAVGARAALAALLAREMDLTARGRPHSSLAGLRGRIAALLDVMLREEEGE